MTKHFSTAVVALASALGFIFLGLPFYGTPAVKTSGYGVLSTSTEIYGGDRAASLVVIKIAIIVLIVLFSLAIIYSLIKLLIDLNVIKIKQTAWTEWLYVPMLALMAIFSLVAVWAVTVHCAAYNGWMEYAEFKTNGNGVDFMYTKMGLGCLTALIIYGILMGADIAWAILLPKMRVWFASSPTKATKPVASTSANKPAASAPTKQNVTASGSQEKKSAATNVQQTKPVATSKPVARPAEAKVAATKPVAKPIESIRPAAANKTTAKPVSKAAPKKAEPIKKPAAKVAPAKQATPVKNATAKKK